MEEILSKIIDEAIINNYSDIHFIQRDGQILLAWRNKDGLFFSNQIVSDKLLSFILYIAKLDVSLRSKPQTGVFEYYYQFQKYSIRVAMVQSFNNISVVLRILNRFQFTSFNDLTDDELAISSLKELLKIDYGIIAFSGPTGSGKTTSAYTMLNQYKNKAIYTIEDPIEIYFDNIVQLQTNEQLGFSFEEGIRQILRHDPDIIFIGEVRDSYSAKMALRSALSGHLVILTIHSGSLLGVIKRFEDFLVSKEDLREVMKGIVNQRLYYQDQMGRFLARYEIIARQGIELWL